MARARRYRIDRPSLPPPRAALATSPIPGFGHCAGTPGREAARCNPSSSAPDRSAGPVACPLKANSLRPTAAADRPARRSRPLPGSRARPACEHTLAASPPTPEDSAGCRHGCRLASTASRSCTRRGPMKHRPSRPIDLSRGTASSSAHGLQICACFARSPRMVQLVSALLRQAARSSPVVNGRTERRPIEAASRQRRWALGLSGRIAAGGPGLPLTGALGL